MKPFKVEITFNSPVFIDSDYPIHLDALIAYAVVKEAEAFGVENAWEVGNDLSSILERTDSGGDNWVWKASRLLFEPASGLMFQNMTRKSDPSIFFRDIGEHWMGNRVCDEKPLGINPSTFCINTGSGQFRGYQWLAASQWMKKVVAYGVGDIDAVTYYIEQLSHVGKAGRNGFGRIDTVSITPADQKDSDKWSLRYLPIEDEGLKSVEYAPVTGCLRPPYWCKKDMNVVMEPIV